MRKMLKGLLGIFLSLVLVLTLMPATCIKVKADTTGTVKALLTNDGTMYVICDANSYNVNCTYDGKTITNVYPCDDGTGNGAMADYTVYSSSPWYSNRDNISAVVIGDDVTRIGEEAFYFSGGLRELTISDSVTSIGDSAFYECYNLGSITIPSSVLSIGNAAFYGCSALQSITIPNTVLALGKGVFYDCTGLTEAIFEDGITTIPEEIFRQCSSLVDVTIPESIKVINDGAFRDCYKLTTVALPEGLTSIGQYAFAACYSLTSVMIHESVETIGEYAFGLSGLQTVEFLSVSSNVASNAFHDVGKITRTYENGNWIPNTQNVEPATLIIPNGFTAGTPDANHNWKGGLFTAKTRKSATVTFKVANGKWNDGTTADKTVTLNGFEGDVLKLLANQIPAVGNIPNDGYQAGSWDVTPSVDTEITGNVTYTYTYTLTPAPNPDPIPDPEPIETIYTISFDANGGVYLGDNLSVELFKTFDFAYKPGKIYRPGYLFAGWYTDPVEGVRIKSDTKFNGNVTTLYAHWIKVFTGKVWSFTARSYSKGRLTVRAEKPLTPVSGYEFEYSDDGVLWITKTKLTGKNDESATTMYFTGLKKGDYKVRVRAFRFDSTGAKIYGAWSKAVTVPVK